MADRGTYLDPQIGLLWENYAEHKEAFLGRGNYTEEGFALMEQARVTGYETFQRTLAHGGVRVVYGTDAVAGAHGRNAEEFVARVRYGLQNPMAAIISATIAPRSAASARSTSKSVTNGTATSSSSRM